MRLAILPPASAQEGNFVMLIRNRFRGMARVAALSLALAVPVASAAMQNAYAQPASADDSYVFGLVTLTPMVHLPIPGATSYAQLIQELQAQGYADIKVTPLSPNRFDPRPELVHPDLTFTSADDEAARDTRSTSGGTARPPRTGRPSRFMSTTRRTARRAPARTLGPAEGVARGPSNCLRVHELAASPWQIGSAGDAALPRRGHAFEGVVVRLDQEQVSKANGGLHRIMRTAEHPRGKDAA
jgi:hypothetical protein